MSGSVLVTGATGFIGSALVRAFVAAGWHVAGCGRRRPNDFPDAAEWRAYDLTFASLPPSFLDGIDAIVHAAVARNNPSSHDFSINVGAAALLLDEARSRGVNRFVFLSSLAAHGGALSAYGKQKCAIERLVEARDGLVLRPGLVLGSGGAFGAMHAYLHAHRFVPLFGTGEQPLQTVYVGDLVETIRVALEQNLRGTYTVAETEPVDYRTFYQTLGDRMGRSITFVPVPFWAAEMALRLVEAFHVRAPIDRDNLLGLKAMRADTGPRAPIAYLPQRTFAENIDLALRPD